MNIELAAISRSVRDLRRGLILPTRLTTELSEFIGIMIGDGHIQMSYNAHSGSIRRDICISGNSLEKQHILHIARLFKHLFGFAIKVNRDNRSNAVLLRSHSKTVCEFLVSLGILVNKKVDSVRIPPLIKESAQEMQNAFLRGLADSDFCLTFQKKHKSKHYYPVIKAGFRSRGLVEDLERLLTVQGFVCSTYYDDKRYDRRLKKAVTMHNIYLYGTANLINWMKEIGFSNNKHKDKYIHWRAYGFCPPGYVKASGES